MACINACPQKAIGMTIPEINPNARYRNEHITLQEIMQANRQTHKGHIPPWKSPAQKQQPSPAAKAREDSITSG